MLALLTRTQHLILQILLHKLVYCRPLLVFNLLFLTSHIKPFGLLVLSKWVIVISLLVTLCENHFFSLVELFHQSNLAILVANLHVILSSFN